MTKSVLSLKEKTTQHCLKNLFWLTCYKLFLTILVCYYY